MWLIERESGFQKGLLQWSYTTTLFPKWNPKIFNLKELSLRCLKAGLLSQPCKTLSGRQMKRSTPHSKTDYTVKANVLVSTRKLTGGRRELQEMFQSLPAPYYTHNNPVKHTKPSEINLHMICHFQILHLSDIPRSLLKGQGSWGILWSSDVLFVVFCRHTWSTCSEQQGVMPGCSGSSSLLCKHSILLHFQPVFPLLTIFFHGVPALPQSVKSKYFQAT